MGICGLEPIDGLYYFRKVSDIWNEIDRSQPWQR